MEGQDKKKKVVPLLGSSTTAPKHLVSLKKYTPVTFFRAQITSGCWNSMQFLFYMIESLCVEQQAVTRVLCLIGRNTICLSVEDWSWISQTINVLRPFEEASREDSAEQYTILSKRIPMALTYKKKNPITSLEVYYIGFSACSAKPTLLPWAQLYSHSKHVFGHLVQKHCVICGSVENVKMTH